MEIKAKGCQFNASNYCADTTDFYSPKRSSNLYAVVVDVSPFRFFSRYYLLETGAPYCRIGWVILGEFSLVLIFFQNDLAVGNVTFCDKLKDEKFLLTSIL